MSNPYDAGPDQPPRIRAGLVVVGIVLGVLFVFVWMTVVIITVYSTAGDSTTAAQDVVIGVVLFLPLVASVVLLCFRRTRQMGAGLVMGMAIGTIALAGFCGGLVVLPGLGA